MPKTTHQFRDYEYDIHITPLEPTPYDSSTCEARLTRIVRRLEDGSIEPVDERMFRIVTAHEEKEAVEKIGAAVRIWVGP